MEDPSILKINVADEVKATPVGMGNQAPVLNKEQLVEDGKAILNDEIARYYEQTMKYLQRYVKPHKVKSRWVTEKDVEYLMKEGEVLLNLCNAKHGVYGQANAIAHSQIEDKEPLRFFVLNTGMVVINPVIISHTKYPVFKTEGCMTYPGEPMKTMLKRFNKVTVRYQTLSPNPDEQEGSLPVISKPAEVTMKGITAEIFQHECAHLNGTYIYDEDYDPMHAIGFGDGSDVSGVHLEGLMKESV